MRMTRALSVFAAACAATLCLLHLLSGGPAQSIASEPVDPLGDPISPVDLLETTTYTRYLPFVARDFELRIDPDDPRYVAGQQWGLETMHAPAAWYCTQANGVVIAIIDSGVDLDHPDLSGVLWTNVGEVAGNGIDDDGNGCIDDVHGCDFVDGDGSPDDANGHGTHVAGIAAAATDNAVGIAGMGWGATIMPVRVLDAYGDGSTLDVMNAIYYAVDHGARVINLSLGGYSGGCGYMASAISYAQAHDVLVVAAAGNDGDEEWFDPAVPGNWFYPAACDDVFGVGATNQDDQRAAFSNYGWWVDVAAPGVGIDSTYPYGSYASLSGTSMATPFVSGLAALVWAKYPAVEWDDVAAAIMDGADDLGTAGWDPYYGAGRIDAARALYSVDLSGAGGAAAEMSGAGVAAEFATVETTRAPYRSGELIVRLPGTPSAAGLAASEVLQAGRAPGVYLIRVPVGQELAQARSLVAQGRVLDAQPNYVLSAAAR